MEPMINGDLVPDNLIIDLFSNAISKPDFSNGLSVTDFLELFHKQKYLIVFLIP